MVAGTQAGPVAREYVKAWALIHILRRLLGFEELPFGTIFNMSVGYDLAGHPEPAHDALYGSPWRTPRRSSPTIQTILRAQFPQFADLEIPPRLTNNVTLSTMHGCPPDEIERIARYMMEERGLHTTVKLNPTLLGKERVLEILHDAWATPRSTSRTPSLSTTCNTTGRWS